MRRFLAGLAVLGGAGIARTAEPAELVQKLGDASFVVREAAAKDLLRLGGAAVPAVLGAIDKTADPAIRERAEGLLPRLQRMAESERYLTPKLVTLEYRNLPLATAVEDLKKQTGIPLVLVPERVALPTRAVTVTTAELPAWQAIEKFCAAAGLKEDHVAEFPLPKGTPNNNPYVYQTQFSYIGSGVNTTAFHSPSTAPILLVDGKADALPGQRSTSIRVLAMPASFPGNRVVRGAGTAIVNLDVAPLPGLNWSGATRVRLIRAEDEDGRPLFAHESSVASQNTSPYSPFAQGGWGGGRLILDSSSASVISMNGVAGRNPRIVPVTLRTDDRAIKSLKRLAGVVIGDIQRPNEAIIVVDDLAKAPGKSFDGPHGIRLSIGDYRDARGGVTVKVRVEMPQFWALQGLGARPSADDLNIGNIQNKLKFSDARGTACKAPQQRSANYTGTNWTQSYEAELYFPSTNGPVAGGGPPVKLELIGTKVSTIEVPFAMENVRLP